MTTLDKVTVQEPVGQGECKDLPSEADSLRGRDVSERPFRAQHPGHDGASSVVVVTGGDDPHELPPPKA